MLPGFFPEWRKEGSNDLPILALMVIVSAPEELTSAPRNVTLTFFPGPAFMVSISPDFATMATPEYGAVLYSASTRTPKPQSFPMRMCLFVSKWMGENSRAATNGFTVVLHKKPRLKDGNIVLAKMRRKATTSPSPQAQHALQQFQLLVLTCLFLRQFSQLQCKLPR